jgi:hypothetical protein
MDRQCNVIVKAKMPVQPMRRTTVKARILAALLLAGSLSTGFASDEAKAVAETVDMKDGSTLYVFRDGSMALENKYGRAVSKSEGEVMETKEGTRITMAGNKFALLDR